MRINLKQFHENVKALLAEESAVRWKAVCCLAHISKQEWEGSPEMIGAAVEALIDPEVLEGHEASNPHFRSEVAKALGSIGARSSAVVPELLRWLTNGKGDGIRLIAVKTLGKIGPEAKTATSAISKILGQAGSPELRCEAAWALARIDPEGQEVGPALKEALHDKNGLVSICGAEALWKVSHKTEKVIPALVRALKDEQVRRAAAQALYRIGSEANAAVPELLAALKVNDRLFRECVIMALRKIDPLAAAKAGVQ